MDNISCTTVSSEPEQILSIPECKALDNSAILRLIITEVRVFKKNYDELTKTLKEENRVSILPVYENLWFSEIVLLTNTPELERNQLIAFVDTIKLRIFKVGRSQNTKDYVNDLLGTSSLSSAVKLCFLPENQNKCSFWEWVYILDQYTTEKDHAKLLLNQYKKIRRYYLLYLFRSLENQRYVDKGKILDKQEENILKIVSESNREYYEIASDLVYFIEDSKSAMAAKLLKPWKNNRRYLKS